MSKIEKRPAKKADERKMKKKKKSEGSVPLILLDDPKQLTHVYEYLNTHIM